MTATCFIVLEGLDGAGKSVAAQALGAHFAAALGECAATTYEPHNDMAAGGFIRQALAREFSASERVLALAYALNRADHNDRVIQPFFAAATTEASRVMVCDRYTLSSLVYQSSETQSMETIMALNGSARPPDSILFLDADPEICAARIGTRGKSPELFDHDFAARRERYYEAMQFLRTRPTQNIGGRNAFTGQITVIDANGTPDETLDRLLDALRPIAPAWLPTQIKT